MSRAAKQDALRTYRAKLRFDETLEPRGFRNEIGSTAIAPYSPRGRPGAPVAWPMDWASLNKANAANEISIRDAASAIAAGQANHWANYTNKAEPEARYIACAGCKHRLKRSGSFLKKRTKKTSDFWA